MLVKPVKRVKPGSVTSSSNSKRKYELTKSFPKREDTYRFADGESPPYPHSSPEYNPPPLPPSHIGQSSHATTHDFGGVPLPLPNPAAVGPPPPQYRYHSPQHNVPVPEYHVPVPEYHVNAAAPVPDFRPM